MSRKSEQVQNKRKRIEIFASKSFKFLFFEEDCVILLTPPIFFIDDRKLEEQEAFEMVVSLAVRGLTPLLLFLLLAVLEYTCWDDVVKLRRTEEGRKLYREGIIANLVNIGIFGPLVYYLAVLCCCKPGLTSVSQQLHDAAGIVIIEGVLYYLVHKTFHQVPRLYGFHSFHHKFNTIILPSTANAVSIGEFWLAYMCPLLIATYLLQADELAAVLGSTVIGISNLLIHTPWMECTVYHWTLVSAADHFEHHRKWQGNYGAPLIHVDRILERFERNKED